jgi:hypothetical protein
MNLHKKADEFLFFLSNYQVIDLIQIDFSIMNNLF